MRVARGFTLGFLQLLLATAAATTSSDNPDGIPEVGIGAVHPICDPLQGGCTSGDEQVQDQIIADLQADDEVTATADVIELGELLCDSLDKASTSTLLRFAITSNETVTAERTSYSEFDGSTFSDGKQRKTWKGEVIDPTSAADAGPRTISMTWASQCETETFLLKMLTRNLDGTISFATSVPCAAGSTMEICMVQYDVDLPEPAEASGTSTRDSARRLTETGSTAGEEHAAGLSSRQLQSNVEVDVMFLYDDAVLNRYSVDYLETLIADELPASNTAAENSLIDLEFKLAHIGKLPYVVGSEDDDIELLNFRENEAVKLLRNECQADLVVLVGEFPSTCGRGYVNIYTTASDEQYGYSLIHRSCFDSRTLTHELGHNMGAAHDRGNSALLPTEYGHGLRYCADDSLARFRTVMAYPCDRNTLDSEDSRYAPRVNYFSNPEVDYLGLPTGTSINDNARVLRENMEVVSNFRARNGEEEMCSAGIPGILSGTACCPSSCGSCGGTGCGGRDGGDGFTGSQACCGGGVKELGRICSSSVGAPCIISDDPPAPTPAPITDDEMCAAGIPGILSGSACCLSSCGSCGGTGCSGRDGGADFTGSEACCGGGVKELGRICSSSVGAPCIVSDDPPTPTPAPVTDDETCAAGIPGILSGTACCPNSCGSCGGTGCSGRDGGDDFTGGEACCGGGVKGLGRICSSSVGAPCIISDDPPAPTPAPVTEGGETCIAGVPGILVSDVCCKSSCGQCGGVGCSSRDGGDDFTGGEACCGGGVRSLNRVCSASVGAPCVVAETETETCIAGVPGILASDVCCISSCGQCGGSGCSQRDGGSDFTGGQACCGGGVRGLGRVCSSSVGAPCVVVEDDDGSNDDDTPTGDFSCDGVEKGDYCCSDGCGECGGSGCSNRGGGLTGDDCCTSDIMNSGRLCSATRAAPCFLD